MKTNAPDREVVNEGSGMLGKQDGLVVGLVDATDQLCQHAVASDPRRAPESRLRLKQAQPLE
jgi:hypothetical protein